MPCVVPAADVMALDLSQKQKNYIAKSSPRHFRPKFKIESGRYPPFSHEPSKAFIFSWQFQFFNSIQKQSIFIK